MTSLACVQINRGEMLFLPAGWFHEVISHAVDGQSDGRKVAGHMAFNYWFHPPDADSFSCPYASPFWARDWLARQETEDDDDELNDAVREFSEREGLGIN